MTSYYLIQCPSSVRCGLDWYAWQYWVVYIWQLYMKRQIIIYKLNIVSFKKCNMHSPYLIRKLVSLHQKKKKCKLAANFIKDTFYYLIELSEDKKIAHIVFPQEIPSIQGEIKSYIAGVGKDIRCYKFSEIIFQKLPSL